MRVKFVERLESKEGARQPCVAEIDFWRFHEPLAEIGYVRRNDIYHESLFEKIDISPDCHVGHAKRCRKTRVVDHLGVFVRKHLPETPHRLRYEVTPEQKIPFKKRLDERLVPLIRFIVVGCEIGAGKSTSEKALCPVCAVKFGNKERSQPFIADASGQGF